MKTFSFAAIGFVCILTLAGCKTTFDRFFIPAQQGVIYPEVDKELVKVYQLGEQNLEEVRSRLYGNARVVGRAYFVGNSHSESSVRQTASNVGSDVVLWHSVWLETVTETRYVTKELKQESTYKSFDKKGRVVETEIEDTETVLVPETYARDRVEHHVLFLRVRP